VNRDEFLALISPEAQKLLAELGAIETKTDVVRLVSQLRRAGHSQLVVAAVLEQAKLRRRAAVKFGEFAKTMFFTEAGLEQASRLQVAALHAGRFRSAGLAKIADLGCGIGAEAMAMAAIDLQVTAIELDEVTAACASYNLAPFGNARVENTDATKIELSGYDGLFFDPARRELNGTKGTKAVRKFDPSDFSPSFDFVLSCASKKPTAVKLGPGHPLDAIPDESEAQWVSVRGDLVELTLWFGSLKRESVARSALLIDANGTHELTSSTHQRSSAPVSELGDFLYEPDNSIIRSQLIAELAKDLGLALVHPEIAYLTSDQKIESPWLRGFRVLENLPFDRKQLKAALRQRDIGILEIKKRGSDLVPEQLRKELQLKGKGTATLIVTRIGDAHRALICEAL
jgi:hypothetical protein